MATAGLLQKLVPQTGFNAASAAGNNGVIDRQDLSGQISQANQNVQGNINNQNTFAQALLAQSQGKGPNLANAQLSNATGQNVENQAALMASQRGTGSNAGLIARQAARQGANIQQQASGQAAVNRLQQQLGTQQQLGNVYGQIGSEAGQNLGINQQAQAAQNNVVSGSTNAANQINAGIASGNTQNQMAALQGIGQAAVGMAAEGGDVQEAGYSQELDPHLQSVSDLYHPHMNMMAKGGKIKQVDALVSPGEKLLQPKEVKKVAKGSIEPIKKAETIPGKPKVPGPVDSYANDTVSKKLPIGGIVIPRHVTQSDDAINKSMEFVKQVLTKKKRGVK